MSASAFVQAVNASRAAAPVLTPTEQAEYRKITDSVCRANALVRRARKRTDSATLAKAEQAQERARARLAAFCDPRCVHLSAPKRIIFRTHAPWTGPNGTKGDHRFKVEMVLDHVDISGPSYRYVRTISETGAPSTFARSAPTIMGVAWFALADQIKTGHMEVI